MAKKTRSASRPPAVVFGDQMERTYQTALNLIAKVKRLSRHRALRSDGGEKLANTFNKFLSRITEEIESSTVHPGSVAEIEETPTLSEFIGD